MRTRLITAGLLSLLLVGALWGAVARAQVLDTNLEITEFVMKPVDTPHSYPATQAGGNPDVSLFFRFCGPGLAVDNVVVDPDPTAGKFIVTTKSAHQVVNPFTFVKMRGVRNPGGVNGVWTAQPITVAGAIDPVRFRLVNRTRPPDSDDAFAPVTADAPNGHAQIAASNDFYGCTGQQSKGKIADFKLRLPPGFLGNPGATLACPTHLFIASSCSDRSILGWSVTETVIDGASNFTPPTRIETPVFNVATLGLEPARLGTRQFPSEPAGPFPIKIDLRTTGDYGIDSALIDIPKNLGGPQALITQIETILCAQVPCKAADPQDPGTVAPLPPTRPFFRNPTSCKPATATLEARSWAPNAVVDTATSTFTPTGCNDVPFDLDLKVEPTTQPAGTPVQNDVTLAYPDFADADIWQGAVKDVDLTLPKGLALNAGGGYGLEACSFEQYGVDPTTLKQTTNAPVRCPEGSQIGTVSVTSPALEGALSGKAFFGPVSGPGRPTEASPWNLFLLIEGAGLRVKLAGKVVVSEDGQVRNFFVNQPEVPFTQLKVSLRGGERAILTSTNTCGTSSGEAKLTAYANKSVVRTPTVENTGCPATRPFNPVVEVAEGIPKKAGANSVSRIVFSRPDGDANLTGLNLSLPAGATGSLAAAPQCPLAQAQAGNCPESTRIGTIRNTVGNGNSLLTVPGELYLSEAIQPGDAASIAVRVPAKVGPIDLGQVVLMNRIFLRDSDNGLEVQMVSKIPTMLDGVPLPIRRVEILVDRPGFFLNPTGCEPRTLTATFFGEGGEQSSSNIALDATQCNELPFGPDLRLIAGAPGYTDQFDHPPFQALVTVEDGEANISNARVVLPLILRPNVPFFNEPGALCNDAQAATDTCPPKSKVGTARALSPLLPYPIAGPVHIVQEIGNVLPKVYVFLRGPTGLEVLLKARNSFLQGRRVINTFEAVPDLPQSYFELNLQGGPNGILNNFEDLCQATDSDRRFDATFTSHSGKQVTTQPRLEIRGCEESDLRAASLSSQSVRLSKKGVAKVKVTCKRKKRCSGRLTLRGKGATGAGNFKISGGKSARVKVKFSSSEVKKVRKAKRMRTKATLKIADAVAAKSSVTLIGPRRR